MIFTPFSGPVLWIGEEQIMIDSLLPRASSLARLIEQPLDSYIRRQTWRGKGAGDTDRSRSQVGPV
jgi:hypothetical protein